MKVGVRKIFPAYTGKLVESLQAIHKCHYKTDIIAVFNI